MTQTQSDAAKAAGLGTGYSTGRRMASRKIHISFYGSIRSELLKLSSLKSTWWLSGLMVLLTPALGSLIIWAVNYSAPIDPNTGETITNAPKVSALTMWTQLAGISQNLAIVAGIFGVMAITTEYTTSAIQSSLCANPRRVMFMEAKAIAVVIYTYISTLIGMGLTWIIYLILAKNMGVTPLKSSDAYMPFLIVFGIPLTMSLIALLSLGFGAICRSTAGGVFSVIGLITILPSILQIVELVASSVKWLGKLSSYLPTQLMANFLRGGQTGELAAQAATQSTPDLLWWQSGLVLVAWTFVCYVVGVIVVKRSDVK